MDFNDFIPSQIVDAFQNNINKMHEENSADITAEQQYQSELDDCIFETRDLLQKICEDSKIESDLNRKRFIIQTVLSVFALAAAVAAAVAAIIALL